MFFRKTISVPDIQSLLSREFALDGVADFQSVHGGTNLCYRFRAGEQDWFLKQTPERHFRDPQRGEPDVAAFLRERGIPTPAFLRSRSGAFAVCWRGQVFSPREFTPGDVYVQHTAPEWLLVQMPDMLGRIQHTMATFRPLPRHCDAHWLSQEAVAKAARALARMIPAASQLDDAELADRICGDLEYRVSQLTAGSVPPIDAGQLTYNNSHGDYVASQLVCGDRAISAVIDFSNACAPIAALELIRSYATADPACLGGELQVKTLVGYVERFLARQPLGRADLAAMPHLLRMYLLRRRYGFKELLSDGPTEAASPAKLESGFWATRTARWLENNAADLSRQLAALAS